MMNVIALVFATAVLVSIPGPNVAMIVANSLRHGLKSGLVTTLGTTAGVAVQLFLVVAGMATVIESAASGLVWIRWFGVAYLLYLGIVTWREPAEVLDQVRAQSTGMAFWRGFGFAIINPKTLLFNAAFLPQFMSGGAYATGELFLLAAVFVAVIILGDMLWAVFAASARNWFERSGHLRNKVTGGLLISAGIGLAFSRRNG